MLWYKKNIFGQLLSELADIWPMPPLNEDAQSIKNKSLTALRIAHRCKLSKLRLISVNKVKIIEKTPTNQNECHLISSN